MGKAVKKKMMKAISVPLLSFVDASTVIFVVVLVLLLFLFSGKP